MNTFLISSAIGLLLCLSNCSGPSSESELDLKNVELELRSVESDHRNAIDQSNIEKILQFYAVDLITISPGEPILYGRDWISDVMNDIYKTYDFHEDFKFIDIRIIGAKVAASFTFKQQMTPLSGGDKITQTGKGICILKRSQTGKWQIEWNCYNYDDSPETTGASSS